MMKVLKEIVFTYFFYQMAQSGSSFLPYKAIFKYEDKFAGNLI
jgi:hypothetical protein